MPYWGQDGVHDIYRDWHEVMAEYDGDRALCGEAWLPTLKKTALWVRPDEMHQAFNFAFLESPWRAADLREVITTSISAADHVGAPSTWVLSNHDVVRHPSRLGSADPSLKVNGVFATDPQHTDPAAARRWSTGSPPTSSPATRTPIPRCRVSSPPRRRRVPSSTATPTSRPAP